MRHWEFRIDWTVECSSLLVRERQKASLELVRLRTMMHIVSKGKRWSMLDICGVESTILGMRRYSDAGRIKMAPRTNLGRVQAMDLRGCRAG